MPADDQGIGLHTYDDAPLAWEPLLEPSGCPHLVDALQTGGAHYAQPLWHLDVLMATFLKNGHYLAHKMSKGYRGYTVDETEAMWERKKREREERGLGWPSCTAIENAGCTSCKTCPHKGKIKSPLNLADRAKPNLTTPAQDSVTRQVKEGKIHPVEALKTLHQRGASDLDLFARLNENYAVVRYGSETLVAAIVRNEVIPMKVENFHKMFANVRVQVGRRSVEVSRLWFEWPGRRQYPDRGVVFEPGGPLEIPNDMLNMWRGFGVEPKQGDWSLMRNHIHDVICSGNEDHFQYVIRWMAYGVQHLDRPIGVAIALRGEEGAGKGFFGATTASYLESISSMSHTANT